jgi:hypothetical protein
LQILPIAQTRGESGCICNMLICRMLDVTLHILALDFRLGTDLE